MVGCALPAARLFDDRLRAHRALEHAAHPDVVEPAAAIRRFPIECTVAPPGIDLLIMRHEFARDVGPLERSLRFAQQARLDRRVADDTEQLLMAPDVVLE